MKEQLWDGWVSTLAIGNYYQNKKKCVVMLHSFRKNKTAACAVFEMSDKIFKGPVDNFSKKPSLNKLTMKKNFPILLCSLLITCFAFAQPKPKTAAIPPAHELEKILTGIGLPYKIVNDSLAVIPYEGINIKSFQVIIQKISDLYIVLSNLTEALPGKINESKYKYLLQMNDNFDIVKIGLQLSRADLYSTINARVDDMMQTGLEEEARKLLPYRKLNAFKPVGYRELLDYFDGLISLDKTVELIKQHTRHYAKRQMTWFTKDESINWCEPVLKNVLEIIG